MKVYIYKTEKPDTKNLPRDKNGKPKPIKLNGQLIHFNISHSEKYWGIAFSNQPIGLDFETKLKHQKKRKFSTAFLQKILAPNEYLIDNNPLHNFVAKEAYSKLTGAGLSLGFSKIDANELIKNHHPYSLEDDNIILYVFTEKL